MRVAIFISTSCGAIYSFLFIVVISFYSYYSLYSWSSLSSLHQNLASAVDVESLLRGLAIQLAAVEGVPDTLFL